MAPVALLISDCLSVLGRDQLKLPPRGKNTASLEPRSTVVSRWARNQRAPGVRPAGEETLGIMGSLGGTVARSIESRGIASGPSVGNLVSSGGGGSGGPSLAALSSAVAATHNTNSLFMANSIQATAATQQRAVSEMLRHMQGIGTRGLSGFVGRQYGSGGGNNIMSLHSNFGGDSAPPPLDLTEFPSLSSRNTDSSQPNPMAGRQPYVGMVKQPTPETSEFTMSSEDFPALPGSQANPTGKNDGFSNNEKKSNSATGTDTPSDLVLRAAEKSQSQKRGIQTSPDGKVTNIPAGMVTDQFGMVGLLTFIRAAETDHNLVSLALGSDLTTLGLNLNSPENLYPNFAGPWAETPCRPQDIDYHVPQEYLTNQQIRGKLAPVKFDRYGEDLLFYMFYSNAGDLLQILAAAELYNRDWRYHKEDRVWITRAPGMAPVDKGPNYERGTYFYFDAQNWRKVPKEFHLEYDKLEERPHIPTPGGLIHTPTSSTL
ncbi:CCR4-NOT transcription complex subunit 2 isoform X2 [Procambarus clarkii]|uniref:CCR4-NOT transcription complex subunit 2 isoform X2 n=2 Tax=Procambarus clarkii TaxID=6728 RepID=UPI001E677C7D|nr:CCR4-NOT transcription complex subunit 2-like isoform X2 [Procambarus clarkii]